MNTLLKSAAVALLAGLVALPVAAHAQAAGVPTCANLARQGFGEGVKITAASHIGAAPTAPGKLAALPAYC